MRSLLKAAWLPVAAHLGLLLTYHLSDRLWLTLGLAAVATLGVAVAVARYASRSGGRLRLGEMLAVAIVLRAILLPVPPSLSEDVWRYAWDAKVAAAGFDPYRLTPDDARLESLRDETWRRLRHRDVETVYPPLALLLFSISVPFAHPVPVLKLLLALFDLGTCVLLWRLASRLRAPPERVLWYAWSPLVTLEIAGMGHVEGLGVFFLVLAVLLLSGERRVPVKAGLAAAAAVLSKLVPVLCLPAFARLSGGAARFALAAGGLSLLVLLPLFLDGPPPGLVRFGVDWEFNGPLYEPLWRGLDALDSRAAVHGWLDGRKLASGEHEFWNRFYPYNYPQMHAKLLLAVLLLALWARATLSRTPLVASGRVFASLVLTSATVYPWYLIWLLPWAALRQRPAWLWLSATVLLSYVPQFSSLPLVPWIHAAIWVPFAFLLLFARATVES